MAEGVPVDQAVVARVGGGEVREPPAGAVVEPAAVDDDPADRGAVAADELGRRVHDDVGAVLERPVQVGRRQGVVDDQRYPGLVRDGRDALGVEDVPARVADRLAVEGARLGAYRGPPGVKVVRVVDERHRDAELGQRVVEQVVGAAVEVRGADDVVAGLGQVEDRQRLRRLPRCRGERADPAFEGGDALLEDVLGGVHDPGVDVARLAEREQRGRVVGVAEDEARRLVDRDGSRTGRRIGLGARVDLLRLERPVRLGHGGSPPLAVVVRRSLVRGGSRTAAWTGGLTGCATPISWPGRPPGAHPLVAAGWPFGTSARGRKKDAPPGAEWRGYTPHRHHSAGSWPGSASAERPRSQCGSQRCRTTCTGRRAPPDGCVRLAGAARAWERRSSASVGPWERGVALARRELAERPAAGTGGRGDAEQIDVLPTHQHQRSRHARTETRRIPGRQHASNVSHAALLCVTNPTPNVLWTHDLALYGKLLLRSGKGVKSRRRIPPGAGRLACPTPPTPPLVRAPRARVPRDSPSSTCATTPRRTAVPTAGTSSTHCARPAAIRAFSS
ncbi:hypothetical protein FRAHR75_360018 [Frankia sp. Hr75.2]|nr:hypothetical protein FRAHR75_360018 [Frankia sp. Hr75.2]